MTFQPIHHGETGDQPNKRPEAGWTFRAPRHGDLVVCPYCDPESFRVCDHCGGEGSIYADDFFGVDDDG